MRVITAILENALENKKLEELILVKKIALNENKEDKIEIKNDSVGYELLNP